MPPPFAIRRAVPLDAAGYIRLIKDVLSEHPPVDTPYRPSDFDPPVERIRDRILDVSTADNSVFVIAQADHQLIGSLTCAGGSLAADAHMTSLGIYVEKRWRDNGVGTALMKYAMEWAEKSAVVRRVELEVFAGNARAIHVYKKFDFKPEGVKRGLYHRDGDFLDMLLMARWLEK